MAVTVKVVNEREVAEKIRRELDRKRVEIERAVGQTAEDIADDWRESVPVDEGDYKDSIGVEHDGLTADVANFGEKGKHGRFVEFGTSRMRARPTAQPAAERGRKTLTDNLTEAVK